MSEFRRRLMMAAVQSGGGGGILPVTDYIQNGLVLLLDGIEKGNVAGAWTDLIGGHTFTNDGAAVFGTDHVSFAGSLTSRLSNSSFSAPAFTAGTIEVVYEDKNRSTKRILFMCNATGKIIFAMSNTSGVVISGTASASSATQYYTIPATNKGSTSVSANIAYHNGSALTKSAYKDYFGNFSSYNYVGARSNGNAFKGDIYSIRIYDRQLTADEILQNYAVDQSRFSSLFT